MRLLLVIIICDRNTNNREFYHKLVTLTSLNLIVIHPFHWLLYMGHNILHTVPQDFLIAVKGLQ